MLSRVIETLLLPPASPLLLLLLGALLARRWPRGGRRVQVFAALLLLVLSLPCTGGLLLAALQTYPALPATGALPPADAIVVLSAEADRAGSEYGGPVVGSMTLQRLRYGAFLQRRTNLPMLVSGGVPASGSPSLAALMANAAQHEFGVPVKWLEEESADTWENAVSSAAMLRAAGCKRVLLVTSAWHMPRAAASFRAQGLDVVAAPTAFRGPAVESWFAFVPQVAGLRDSNLALHELVGRVAYWLQH